MITRDLHRLTTPDAPESFYVGTLANCAANALKLTGDCSIVVEPHCKCCGVCGWGYSLRGMVKVPGGQWRCNKHAKRNPCAIEGCQRTTKAEGAHYGDDLWLCSEHWRIGCPPRSKMRRAYQRYFRRGRRFGWNESSIASFNAFWRRLVVRARKRCAGDIDQAEINRMFGWE